MKITIYELLGMIKDGNIPKKIYYLGHYYTWKETDEDYQKEDGLMLFGNSKINYILDTPVKIVDIEYLNNDLGNKLIKPFIEPKIPEKLSYILHVEDDIAEIPSNEMLMNKINEILDYLEKENNKK